MSGDQGPTTEVVDGYLSGLLTRREALARLGVLGLGLLSASVLLSGCTPSTTNVLLIIADDMRYDQLPYMSNVQNLIANPGRTFTQARCNVPLCQPSRVGLFTGQMSKHNNEINVGFSGTAFTDTGNALAKWMNDAGYACGHFGKYINWLDGFGGVNAPAGYHTWREIISETSAYEFRVHLNSGTQTITGQYMTDYLAAQASGFISSAAPFFCVVTPTQPHAPFFPRDDLADDWLGVVWPIVDEVDVSDKPSWIQALPALTDADKAQLRSDAIGSLQELSAVDDMVGQILSSMTTEVLNNTVVIFTSDNGVHRGEHRRLGSGTKSGPYEVGLHVPMIVRGPGFPPGPPITVPVMAFQDIAATTLDVGGATAGRPDQAGTSLVELCAHPAAYRERILLHETGQGFPATGDGLTTGPQSPYGFRKLYRYPSVRSNPSGPFTFEAYDLATDPDELSSWANNAARRDERNALEAELMYLLYG